MGLMSALTAATSGLRTTQAGIDVVAQNVANADSIGYSRRRVAPVQTLAGENTSGVRSGAIERMIDIVAQRQMRFETAGAAYTSLTSRYALEVDRLFGSPGGAGALDTSVNQFTTALQGLATDPASNAARSAVLDAGATLAQRIGSIADGVQSLRTETESRIASAVARANDLLAGIESLNRQVVAANAGGGSAALLDERDRFINELSQLMDVQTAAGDNGSIRVTTGGGLTLFDGSGAVRLAFDGGGVLSANALYSTDPARRGVGTITATTVGGRTVDVIAGGYLRSGEIAAALELRDTTLVQAQRQLDELAAGLSRALSDRPAPTAAIAGGHAIDLTGLQAGNAVTLDLTVNGQARRVLLVPTDGQAPDPIPAADTSDPAATIVRFQLTAPIDGGEAAAIQAGLAAAGLTSVNVAFAGGRLEFTSAAPTTTVNGLSAGVTETSLTSGGPQLPFFVDAADGRPFTGSFEGVSHLTGFAQRMAVNPALLADRSRLVVMSASPPTPQGDTTRAQHLLDSLSVKARNFSSAAGVGGSLAPTTATVVEFAQRIVETQGRNAESMQRLDEGQKVALAAVESRMAEMSGVNIDQEMSQLIALQTAYGANARVMSAVKDMLDLLMRM